LVRALHLAFVCAKIAALVPAFVLPPFLSAFFRLLLCYGCCPFRWRWSFILQHLKTNVNPKPKMLLLLRRSLPPLSRSAAAFCCFLGL
jgi:hypothetical protein